MKITVLAALLSLSFVTACATKPEDRPETAAPVAVAPPPAPEVDSISGRVVSDDEVIGVPPHVEVRLMFGQEEIARQKVDDESRFKFEAPLSKGKYELIVRAGVLNGSRAITYPGGEMKNVGVVIAKKEARRHRRRRHRH